MQQQMLVQDDETLELRETFTSLQQEVEAKTKKLKKVEHPPKSHDYQHKSEESHLCPVKDIFLQTRAYKFLFFPNASVSLFTPLTPELLTLTWILMTPWLGHMLRADSLLNLSI